MSRLFVVLTLLFSVSAGAQPSKSLDQLQREEKLNNAIATVDEFDAKLQRMIAKRKTECSMAFGHDQFCTCVMADLPIAWSFSDYVAITTKTKEENGYPSMNGELRAAYDKVSPIRNKCVAKINAKP